MENMTPEQQVNGPSRHPIETTITNYGNLCFDCGEYDGECGDYHKLAEETTKAKESIISAINDVTADYMKRIAELEFKLKAQGFCDICWTCSWEPAAPGEPEAVELSEGRGWVVCSMCRMYDALEARIDQKKAKP